MIVFGGCFPLVGSWKGFGIGSSVEALRLSNPQGVTVCSKGRLGFPEPSRTFWEGRETASKPNAGRSSLDVRGRMEGYLWCTTAEGTVSPWPFERGVRMLHLSCQSKDLVVTVSATLTT